MSSRITISEGTVEQRATGGLRSTRLRAKNAGDLESAIISAGHYAKKLAKTMYVYLGNSYGHALWRVSYKPSEYLDRVNNMGAFLYSVTPDLTVARHERTG